MLSSNIYIYLIDDQLDAIESFEKAYVDNVQWLKNLACMDESEIRQIAESISSFNSTEYFGLEEESLKSILGLNGSAFIGCKQKIHRLLSSHLVFFREFRFENHRAYLEASSFFQELSIDKSKSEDIHVLILVRIQV